MTFVTLLNNDKLWYFIKNVPSSKAPLVLIQGRGLDHHGWDSVLNEFTDRTIVLIDHRGTGQTTAPLSSEWSTRDFANDIITILDHAGIDKVHVYGHSMGGRIAQWLAAEHADRIIALAIGGASVGDGTGLPRPAAGVAALASGDPSALASLFYPDDWIAANPQQAASVFPTPHSPEVMSIHGKASDRPDGPIPENITVPTLILHGTDDPISDPGNAAILGNRIPRAEVCMIPGARHAYWAGNPEVHASVAKFLLLNDLK
ncbi:alpha/beta fold hydrolase [Corynebacterium durum]|jgi:alpha/beta hydrolase family protein